MFALLQEEESRMMVMDVKQDVVPRGSALANGNVGNTVTNTMYGGGRGRGPEGNSGGNGGGRCSGRGPPIVGRGYGGQPNTYRDKLYCTHCGRYRHMRETCWDLNGQPRNVYATPAEVEHSNESTKQETNNKNCNDELVVL